MRRLLLTLPLALALLSLVPTSAAAVGEAPLPVPPPFPPVPSPTIACPPVEWVDGVPVPPADAPADCVYIAGIGEPGGDGDPCAPGPDGMAPEMCQGGIAPDAPTYTISTIELASGERFTPAGATLLISDGSLSATVGCNRIAGAATLGSNGSLDLLQLMMTKMYCPELAGAEEALLAVLGGGNLRLIALEGGAQIESSTGALELAGALGTLPIGDGPASGSDDSTTSPLLFLLLLLPLGAAAVSILLALTSAYEERRR